MCALELGGVARAPVALRHRGTASVLPADFVPPASGTTVSHVELSACGGYAFVGNRIGVGVDGACAGCVEGAISVVKLPADAGSGEMELVDFVYTNGRVPRSFCLTPAIEGHAPLLLVGNQESDTVQAFKFDPAAALNSTLVSGVLTPRRPSRWGTALGTRAPKSFLEP